MSHDFELTALFSTLWILKIGVYFVFFVLIIFVRQISPKDISLECFCFWMFDSCSSLSPFIFQTDSSLPLCFSAGFSSPYSGEPSHLSHPFVPLLFRFLWNNAYLWASSYCLSSISQLRWSLCLHLWIGSIFHRLRSDIEGREVLRHLEFYPSSGVIWRRIWLYWIVGAAN